MLSRGFRLMLRHRSLVTGVLLAALLVNLLVVARLQPGELAKGGDLPIAARCQGGGPGCAEQPLIPPPVGGLPHFDAPPAPVFGRLVAVEPGRPNAVHEATPVPLDRPPSTAFAV
jgi:hypothetical protein